MKGIRAQLIRDAAKRAVARTNENRKARVAAWQDAERRLVTTNVDNP